MNTLWSFMIALLSSKPFLKRTSHTRTMENQPSTAASCRPDTPRVSVCRPYCMSSATAQFGESSHREFKARKSYAVSCSSKTGPASLSHHLGCRGVESCARPDEVSFGAGSHPSCRWGPLARPFVRDRIDRRKLFGYLGYIYDHDHTYIKPRSQKAKAKENSALKTHFQINKSTAIHHIALLFFANLFFCSPSSLKLLKPKKLLFFF